MVEIAQSSLVEECRCGLLSGGCDADFGPGEQYIVDQLQKKRQRRSFAVK